MGFFDRLLGSSGELPPTPPPEEANFEFTVTIGEEVSTFLIPREPSEDGPTFINPRHAASAGSADQSWVSSQQEVEIAGRHIAGGLFYRGQNLLAGNRDFPIVEPALIDPSLEVSSHASGEGPSRFYWPSYQRLSPTDRATYLEWLAGPRRACEVSQSLAFLYFYGLERRLLRDPEESSSAASERDVIAVEMARLKSEAEDDQERSALTHQLGQLLEFLEAQDLLQGRSNPPPPRERSGWQVPMSLRLMLGEVANANLPLPTELALSWTLTSPEAYLRTPAQRCTEEFAALFERRYREQFGDGLTLPRGKQLQVGYRASSPGLQEIGESTTLPDIADSPKLVEPLRNLARDCCAELDPYSRLLGRKPTEVKSLKGIALLPTPLLESHTHEELGRLRDLLQEASSGEQPWFLEADALLSCWPDNPSKLPKKEAVSLAQLVEKLGVGIEPDVRFGGSPPAPGGAVVVFPVQEQDSRAPSPAYATAVMLLDLVAAVAAADGTVTAEEERHIEAHVESTIDLYPGERERLRSHVEQVTRSNPSFAGLRKKLEPLTADQKERIGSGLVAVAAADGQISPSEIKVLRKIFGLLGLDSASVYSEAHSAATGAGAGANEPFVVDSDQPEATRGQDRGKLDRSAIEAKLEETATVSSMLAGIFDNDDGNEADSPPTSPPAEAQSSNGLNIAQAAFARNLAEQPSWSRTEIEALAAQRDLLVDGALEVINDAAFECCDAPFSEGDDPIEIDLDVAKEMLS
jgi:tellurite resistance protein